MVLDQGEKIHGRRRGPEIRTKARMVWVGSGDCAELQSTRPTDLFNEHLCSTRYCPKDWRTLYKVEPYKAGVIRPIICHVKKRRHRS